MAVLPGHHITAIHFHELWMNIAAATLSVPTKSEKLLGIPSKTSFPSGLSC
jgi:hypothetical protein